MKTIEELQTEHEKIKSGIVDILKQMEDCAIINGTECYNTLTGKGYSKQLKILIGIEPGIGES